MKRLSSTLFSRSAVTVLAASALLALGGCATGPEVRTHVDSAVSFGQFKTFAFVQPLGTDRSGYQTMVSQHLKTAAQRELETRGLKYSEKSPQLLVNFNGQLSEKVRITTMPTATVGVGYYGYRRGMYGAWPMYVDQTTATPYKEGTLNVDVVDKARNQLIWEAVVIDTVGHKDLQQLPASIDAAVAAAFAKFPVAAPAAAAAPAEAPKKAAGY